MQLRIERRAEIALRSLQKTEQEQINRVLQELRSFDRATLSQNSKLSMISSGYSSRKLFVYKVTRNLRLVLTFDGDTCVLEDIVDHDRLYRLINNEVQK